MPKKSGSKKGKTKTRKTTSRKKSRKPSKSKPGVEDILLRLLQIYGRAVSRRRLHELVYLLENKYGFDLGLKFYGNPPFSKELDDLVARLIEEDLIRVLYVVGENYLTLYKPYYKLSGKGLEEVKELDKGLEEVLVKLVEDVKNSRVSATVSMQ